MLEVKQLSKKFDGFALQDVSFSLNRGYIMGFIGPNGAGKSTTIKLIMNLLRKDSGEIKIFGKDPLHRERDIKNKIGFVYDENYYYEELTINEMKKVVCSFYKTWDEVIFQRYLREFNLPSKKKIKDLSKGMKMKFSLAIALSHHAELLIMDEPTSGLDPIVRSELLEILTTIIQDENKSVFFSTHITSDLDKIADYITFIHEGRIILSAPKDELLENYALVKGAKQLLTEEVKDYFVGIKENQFGFEGLVQDRALINKAIKDSVIIDKPTLEDIMLYSVRRVHHV
ncbi:ABC transporter ATP-binding protein [Bacillus salinus]|uniref:ABC transporter ATP-binding protein n=1 Tax=Bacillus sp. HMF5848 TaxID=2495421 RepID=UPI001C8BD89F|nr:ABC transporter ATP-binding protein [Bacillus sp. HMF5848]